MEFEWDERKDRTNTEKHGVSFFDAPEDIGEALEYGKKIVDLLPPPEKLVKRIPKVKVTITLNSRSVDFFKKFAKDNHVKYQTMINEVLDQYASKFGAQSEDHQV